MPVQQPFPTPPGEPPVQPTPPAPYEAPTGFGLVAPEARRARRRAALAVMAASLVVALVSAVAVVVPLLRRAQDDADEALAGLAQLETEPEDVGAVDGPDRVPLPLDQAPPVAEPVDGRYVLDAFVRFDGTPRLEGEPVDGWTVDPADPAHWQRDGCGMTRQEDEVVTFDVPDASTTDRSWTVEGMGFRAFFLEDEVESIVPRGTAVPLTVPASDGALLEALGQVYDITAADGRRLDMVLAARALTWHDVTYYLTLVCPAGTVTDPVAAMQDVLDGHRLVLP